MTPEQAPAAPRTVGYLEVLRRNPAFHNLWLGNVVSLTGDWFTTIALFAMLLEFTGRGEAVGYALISRFLPTFLFGPLAGVCADRFPRRTILLGCDLARAAIVPGFLLIRGPGDVWLAYLLSFLQLSASAFFDPAEQAATGSAVTREEIVTANTLQGITWSAMLAMGAALGGLVTGLLGRDAAFLLDAVSYLLSALFISRVRLPPRPAVPRRTDLLEILGVREVVAGLRYVLHEPNVRRVILAKAGWGLAGGGALLLYSVFGERVFPVGRSAATGIGLLYAARGVGALLGPLLARRVGGDAEAALDRAIGICFVGVMLAYGLFAWAPILPVAALALTLAHMGIATIWIFSTALMNLWVPDALKGRTFSADLSLFTLALTVSTFFTGFGLDRLHLSPRVLMGILALLLAFPALLWRLVPRRPLAGDAASTDAAS